ncbi:MAG: discoidin domain-containing protein [Bacteroidales bacterium]|jgi:hypothetical protein|nr:discoidin domain-containing protein [Bacteroidales bacterium]
MMKKDRFIVSVVIVLLIASGCFIWYCHQLTGYYSPEITEILKLAGSNRSELEKVLKHYDQNPADSLKLRAAEFLIINMPGKYSEYYDAPWNDVATVHLRWTSSSDKQLVLDTYRIGKPVRQDDVTHITAEYLINNIELAFKVWQEQSWGKNVPFNVFCEEILPYRVSTEPIENWREKVLASFADLYKSLIKDTTVTAVEACSRLNDLLPRFRLDKDFPPMSYSQLMASTRGSCDRSSVLAVFAMRGLGIPVIWDFTPRWPSKATGHSWNGVRNSCGVHISFMGTESNPGKEHQGAYILKSKVYRYVYTRQQHIMADEINIPPLLRDINSLVDVTAEYEPCADIRVPVQDNQISKTRYAFLAIPFEMGWDPVAWGNVDTSHIQFLSVGKNSFYLPVYYHNGSQTPASYPFRINEAGECRYFRPDSLQMVSLTCIAPPDNRWVSRMKGGMFEVANRSDFSDARLIHTVKTIPDPYYHVVSVNLLSTYRYVRYVSPIDGHCNVSILEFYDENNEKLKGRFIGEAPKWLNPLLTNDKAFDGDVDTFCDAVADPSWTGLDLGEPKQIVKIRYLPRTDGNCIYEGHVYELFFWNGDEWHSLGRKTADSHILQYEVPDNALLTIKNITKGKMYAMPFYIEDDIQKWFKSTTMELK